MSIPPPPATPSVTTPARPPARRTPKLLAWALTIAMLAAAWGLTQVTLPDDAALAPFVTAATLGDPATARNLAVTVTDVRAARTVTDAGGWSAEGTWVVVDLEAAAVVAQQNARLTLVELVVGDRTYSATDRGTTFRGQSLVPGVPRSGALAFELPADALTGTATLRLGAPGVASGAELDGVIEMTIDLDALPVESEATITENGWAR
ncbi:hypothetical protein [Microbacterium sp. NPDC089696]|uniref:hypothetical protein n=1 Tax=Microbacterium sp. NPDC089696 TaxID=3364199 RepID=UPI0038292D2C